MNRIKRIYHPEVFQGVNQYKNYFEGWYFKVMDRSMNHVLAVIPGVSLGPKGEGHSFIQILDGLRNYSEYFRYELSDFRYNPKRFEVMIGKNYFSQRRMELDLPKSELGLKGALSFENIIPFPKTLRRPGIMGPYSFVPFMECYHGIVNIHHDIDGSLEISGDSVDFTKGYGYIEKDWGRSFPEHWIWFQSNHFHQDASLMFSLAKIPWMGRSFPGFISFLRIKKRIYLFASYTKASISTLEYKDQHLYVILEDKRYRLEMLVQDAHGGHLKAPGRGLMNREIIESMNGKVEVLLTGQDGKVIFQGRGDRAGFEYHQGDVLLENPHKKT